MKDTIIGQDKRKLLSLFANDIIIYAKNPFRIFRYIILWLNEFRKNTGFKDDIQKAIVFLYVSNKQLENEIKRYQW